MCLKESCFPDCWKMLSVVPVFWNVGQSPTARNYRIISLLSEKPVNNRLIGKGK